MNRRGQENLIPVQLDFHCESARLLLIDDEPLITRFVEASLKKAGFKHVISLNDPTQAMELLGKISFDLIVLDIEMDKLNGLDLLKQIRESEELNDVSVIVLSGTNKAKKYRALRMGAVDFVDKPVAADELELRIRNALRIL